MFEIFKKRRERLNENFKQLQQEISELKKKLNEVLKKVVTEILTVAYHLQPFLPDTSEKIIAQFTAPKITSQPPLFPRIID